MRSDITALEIRPGEGSVTVGASIQLNLFALTGGGRTELIPGNGAAWSSSDAGVAEVNRQGRLKARRPGTVTVTASYSGKTVSAVFTAA